MMDYDLARQVETPIAYDVTHKGNRYGDMPKALLTTKYEETDMGDEENMYDDFVRGQITNWGPDTNAFEHEGSRGGVTKRSGKLNLQYYGHRGEADVEMPEMFLGFAGPEDRDPRGVAIEPDFKELTKQQKARMRFQRFDKDMSDHIGSGNRSEARVMKDNQTVFRTIRERLKIFDRHIDGRREGLRRGYKNQSEVSKQVFVQSYGDYIKDYAMNPQRRANVVIGQLVKDSREWRDFTNDQDFAVAKYINITRKYQAQWKNTARTTETDARFTDADTSMAYKTAGLLMSQIVRSKRQQKHNMDKSDGDFGSSQTTKAGKTAPLQGDLTAVMRHIENTMTFGTSDITRTGKTLSPQEFKHVAKSIAYNHVAPAHHYLNAEIIYKNAKKSTLKSVKQQIITDNKVEVPSERATKNGKSAKRRMMISEQLKQAGDHDGTESLKTMSYKHIKSTNGNSHRLFAADSATTESMKNPDYKNDHTNYRVTNKEDLVQTVDFGNNHFKDRHGGRMGTKYTNHLITRDGAPDSMESET